MIKYRTRYERIEAIEVLRETEKQVVLSGKMERRENKRSDWSNWHDTFDDARNFLIDLSEKEIKTLQSRIDGENLRLSRIKAMTQPTNNQE